jgi:hypothetical protein
MLIPRGAESAGMKDKRPQDMGASKSADFVDSSSSFEIKRGVTR